MGNKIDLQQKPGSQGKGVIYNDDDVAYDDLFDPQSGEPQYYNQTGKNPTLTTKTKT